MLYRLCPCFVWMLVRALGDRHPELSGIVLQWASYFPFLPLKHGMKLSFPVLSNTMTFFLIQEKLKNFIIQLKIHNQTFELNLSVINIKIIYINLRGKIQQNKASIPMKGVLFIQVTDNSLSLQSRFWRHLIKIIWLMNLLLHYNTLRFPSALFSRMTDFLPRVKSPERLEMMNLHKIQKN